MNKVATISIITAGVLFSGCVQSELSIDSIKQSVEENLGKIGGTAVGAGAGAAIGKQVGGDQGMLIGAVAGGTLGYLIGNEIDKRRSAIKEIVKEASTNSNNIEVSFSDVENKEGEKIGQSYIVTSEISQFDSGKDKLNIDSIGMFEKIAKQYAKSGQSVMIIGHTDSDGSDEFNQKLSEKRAKTIAELFNKNGVDLNKMYYKGAGESEPLVLNNTNEGKAKNRRVEIVEVPDEATIAKYEANKKINNALLPIEKTASTNKNKTNFLSSNNNLLNDKSGSTAPKREPATALNDDNNILDSKDAKISKQPKTDSITKTKEQVKEKQVVADNKDIPLDIKGAKISEPLIAGKNLKKFKNQDVAGDKLSTGVKGNYYTSQDSSKEEIGSCSNEYAYSKKSNLDIKWESATGNNNELLVLVGQPEIDSAFSLVTPAVADENLLAYYGSCLNDLPRKNGNIKKLSTGEVVLAKQNYELAPLLNGSSWATKVDNEFIMINPVGIKRANMQSVSCPEMNVIKNGANQPWYGSTTEIVSYNGKDGLLYRVYPRDTSKLQCIDIAYPHGNPQDAKGVVYHKDINGNILSKKVDLFSVENKGSI
ncbi:OmpA family protein [Sulfurimonas sp.]|uniref:OmpA family protein n=1 Tax=Sulfurimonas sp. TaxID=2022749 RepID=UPI003D097FE3